MVFQTEFTRLTDERRPTYFVSRLSSPGTPHSFSQQASLTTPLHDLTRVVAESQSELLMQNTISGQAQTVRPLSSATQSM